MTVNAFYESLSPFWFTTKNNGIVTKKATYFDNKLKDNKHFFEYFSLKNIFIKDSSNIIENLRGKVFRLLNADEPPFRVNIHESNGEILFLMWPMLKSLDEVKKFDLSKELSHPASVISDIIIAKDMYVKNFKKLTEAQKIKFDQEKLKQFSSIISSTPSCLTIMNAQNDLIYINKQGINILDAEDLEDPLAIDMSKVVLPEFIEEIIHFHNSICEGKTATVRYRIKTLKGKYKWMESYSAPYELSDGSIAHISISNDITDKIKEEEESLKQKEFSFHKSKLASLGELAAGVGHEINNPLAIISGNLELLKFKIEDGVNSIDDTSPHIEKISNALDRIAKIVKGLKNFSRDDEETKTTINLSAIINESIDMVEEIFEKLSIKILRKIPQDIYINGIRGRIQQVLINLLNNSKDAMKGKDGTITLTLRSINNKVYLRLKDEGTGIDKDIANRIFDPFFTTKDVNEGTGIGLSICHQIINDHRGNIVIEESNESGTKFLIQLDQVEKPEQQDIQINNEKDTSKTSKDSLKRILVADDEKSIREIISLMLANENYLVTCVEDGQQAWSLLQEQEFDVLITDIQMPHLNGYQLLKKIQEDLQLDIYKIVLTGGVSLNISDNESGLKNRMDTILEKPFKKDQLIQLIENKKRDGN